LLNWTTTDFDGLLTTVVDDKANTRTITAVTIKDKKRHYIIVRRACCRKCFSFSLSISLSDNNNQQEGIGGGIGGLHRCGMNFHHVVVSAQKHAVAVAVAVKRDPAAEQRNEHAGYYSEGSSSFIRHVGASPIVPINFERRRRWLSTVQA
jgi:hypothetical protein